MTVFPCNRYMYNIHCALFHQFGSCVASTLDKMLGDKMYLYYTCTVYACHFLFPVFISTVCAIDPLSEEASVSSSGAYTASWCVCPVSYCALIGMRPKLLPTLHIQAAFEKGLSACW